MASDTDFLALFQELGLSSSCRLDEFKLAFRRRVSQLHPDRHGSGFPDNESRLQRLTAMYEAAMVFHRQHGRLPGYSGAYAPARAASQKRSAPPGPPVATPGVGHATRYVFVGLILLALAAWWLGDVSDDNSRASDGTSLSLPAAEPSVTDAHKTPAAQKRLALGMSRQDVLVIQGEPVSSTEDHWDYGPSSVSFRCSEVSDWYSSPLRPLHVESPHPTGIAPPISPMHAAECRMLANP
jgi:hypothetical protein